RDLALVEPAKDDPLRLHGDRPVGVRDDEAAVARSGGWLAAAARLRLRDRRQSDERQACRGEDELAHSASQYRPGGCPRVKRDVRNLFAHATALRVSRSPNPCCCSSRSVNK